MTRSVFLLPEEHDASPLSIPEESENAGLPLPPIPVGAVSLDCSDDESLTDEAREQAIQRARTAMEHAYAKWEGEGCFAARGDAQRLQNIMAKLIRGRSPEQVARMERERGLI